MSSNDYPQLSRHAKLAEHLHNTVYLPVFEQTIRRLEGEELAAKVASDISAYVALGKGRAEQHRQSIRDGSAAPVDAVKVASAIVEDDYLGALMTEAVSCVTGDAAFCEEFAKVAEAEDELIAEQAAVANEEIAAAAEELHALYQAGEITEEEFEAAMTELEALAAGEGVADAAAAVAEDEDGAVSEGAEDAA